MGQTPTVHDSTVIKHLQDALSSGDIAFSRDQLAIAIGADVRRNLDRLVRDGCVYTSTLPHSRAKVYSARPLSEDEIALLHYKKQDRATQAFVQLVVLSSFDGKPCSLEDYACLHDVFDLPTWSSFSHRVPNIVGISRDSQGYTLSKDYAPIREAIKTSLTCSDLNITALLQLLPAEAGDILAKPNILPASRIHLYGRSEISDNSMVRTISILKRLGLAEEENSVIQFTTLGESVSDAISAKYSPFRRDVRMQCADIEDHLKEVSPLCHKILDEVKHSQALTIGALEGKTKASYSEVYAAIQTLQVLRLIHKPRGRVSHSSQKREREIRLTKLGLLVAQRSSTHFPYAQLLRFHRLIGIPLHAIVQKMHDEGSLKKCTNREDLKDSSLVHTLDHTLIPALKILGLIIPLGRQGYYLSGAGEDFYYLGEQLGGLHTRVSRNRSDFTRSIDAEVLKVDVMNALQNMAKTNGPLRGLLCNELANQLATTPESILPILQTFIQDKQITTLTFGRRGTRVEYMIAPHYMKFASPTQIDKWMHLRPFDRSRLRTAWFRDRDMHGMVLEAPVIPGQYLTTMRGIKVLTTEGVNLMRALSPDI